MKTFLAVAAAVLSLALPASAWGAVYAVTQDGAGADYDVAAFNALSGTGFAGDTFYFSGTITSTITPAISGTPGHPVTLDGYEAGDCDPIHGECTDSAELAPSTAHAIYLTTQDHFVIQDFRIVGGNLTFSGSSASDNSEHVVIRRNEIHDHDGNCIDLDWGRYFTIGGALGDGNEIYDCGTTTAHADISPNHAEDVVISHNHLYATKSNGDDGDRGIDGITTHYVRGMLVEYNTIHSHNDRFGDGGENGMDLKRETHDVIIRFNAIYDHRGESNVILQGGTHDVYLYGNRLMGLRGGVLVYARQSGFMPIDGIHIWSNELSGNGDCGVCTLSDGDPIDEVHLVNNTIAFNGFAYTKLDGTSETPNQYDCGVRLLAGTTHLQNNIFFQNQPDLATYVQASDVTGTAALGALEHNTYHWPGQTSVFGYDGAGRTVAELQSSYGLEDDAPAGEDADPGLVDAAGGDDTYGTEDDDYRLDGTYADTGAELSQCFSVQIQGQTHTVCYEDGLSEDTDFTTIPPTASTAKQGDFGSGWDRGAYVYGSASVGGGGGGVGGGGGSGVSGGTGGAGGVAGGGAVGAPDDVTDDEGSCGCKVTGARQGRGTTRAALLWAVTAALGLCHWRRRRCSRFNGDGAFTAGDDP